MECAKALLTGIAYMYIAISCKKDSQVHITLHDISYTLDGLWDTWRYFRSSKNVNVANNGPQGDLGLTPRIVLTALFCEMNRGCLFGLHAEPQIARHNTLSVH